MTISSLTTHIKKPKKDDLIIILGPTASGKSHLAVKIAKIYDGEIISADSRQVYKDLNIGTGKMSKDEMQDIPHHLMSFLDAGESFSVGVFKKKAEEKIREIQARKKLPILCGGTGLFIDAVARNYQIPSLAAQENFRKEMEPLSREEIFLLLPSEIREKHPEKEKRKMIRALELINFKDDIKYPPRSGNFNPVFYGIFWERNKLYDRINDRTNEMFKNGILEECQLLIERKLENTAAASGIAYREGILFLQKKLPLEEAIVTAQKRARNYAKRQLTWFRKNQDVVWIPGGKLEPVK